MSQTIVPLLDLKIQYSQIRDEIKQAIEQVLESQIFILGREVEQLEREIADYCNSKFAVGVSSGSDALLVSLMSSGIGPGDEVITTPFTFFATIGSVIRVGASVAFVDVDPVTFNMDPAGLDKALTKKTKAIIPIHLFGQSADMKPIMDFAQANNLVVIEDAAQAIGTEYMGQRAGSMGDYGCFSFFPSKNLGAFGDGGLVTTNNPELADRIKILRNHGAEPKYYHKLLGGNFRLDALQAAVLSVKLKYLDQWTNMRRQNAEFYTSSLENSGISGGLVIAPKIVRERHVFNQYVIRAKKRDQLRDFLSKNGISTEIYYPVPMHLQECVNSSNWKTGDFPISERAASEVLALPIFPELTMEQKQHVVNSIISFYNS